jgi:hypothetical protein
MAQSRDVRQLRWFKALRVTTVSLGIASVALLLERLRAHYGQVFWLE